MARITPEMPQRGASRNLIQVIDNYYRPARDRMGEAAMAKGFSDVSNFFGNEAAKAKKQQLQEIAMQGQQDALAGLDPNEELAQVRKGLLFRSNSQAYNQAYNETMGKKAAIEFKEQATLDYEKSGMKYSTDPNRFREWMNERVHGFLTAEEHNNPYFLAGAMPYIEQTTFNMSAAHSSNISAQMERNHLAAIQKQADDIALGVSSGEISLEEGIGALAGLNNQAYGTGFSGPKSRSALLASWLSVADATDNLEMINALTAAQESGVLRLTPQEWNTITKEGEGIERDINFRQDQKDRAAKAQLKAEEDRITDAVADFYNNPANAAVPFQTFLQAPVGDTGQTMADIINASPNTDGLMKKAKDAYTTINSIYDIPQSQESLNNLAIDAAFDNNEIQTPAQLVDWFKTAQADGLRFNENNWKHAEELMRKFNDPEEPHGTQTYKDYKQATLNRVIGALTPDQNALSFSFEGEYQGGMSDDIKIRFQSYLDEGLAAIPIGDRKNPEKIRAAIEAAERATMDFYKENDPTLFNKQFESFSDAVNEGKVSWTSNPYFAQEAARLLEEQAALEAQEEENMRQNRVDKAFDKRFDRQDLDIQAGLEILGGGSEEEAAVTTLPQEATLTEAEIAARDAANAALAEQEAAAAEKAEQRRLAEVAAQEAEQAKIAEQEQLMSEVGTAVKELNDLVVDNISDDEFVAILNGLQEKFNLTLPTNATELNFLMEDLYAFQEEAGVAIDRDVYQKLMEAAMRRMRK
ncbi:hypothetical protein CRP403_gp33 [Roseobacter phage CRP-403]|uniref:Coil containing protein n=2 Tax=root TaxID=1 RepID=A0AAX3ZY94_9CAUD|nr:hypothetical protein CRP403_gp33 [Roseobacter phage CRP-403]